MYSTAPGHHRVGHGAGQQEVLAFSADDLPVVAASVEHVDVADRDQRRPGEPSVDAGERLEVADHDVGLPIVDLVDPVSGPCRGSSCLASCRFCRTVAQRRISPSSRAKLGPKISSTRGSRSERKRNAAPDATTRTSWRASSDSITTSERVAWPMPSPLTPYRIRNRVSGSGDIGRPRSDLVRRPGGLWAARRSGPASGGSAAAALGALVALASFSLPSG